MKYIRSRGFTLIELLVVIAIIGVLSAVVLASLNTARTKGNDAAVRANLDSARAQAEIYYDTNGSYTGVCAAATGVLNMINGANAANGSGVVTCNATVADAYAISAAFNNSTTAFFCVDSTGKAATSTTNIGTNNTCN
jgi:prepilin-type N-terminal cleavage/methylation domain-containing protein